MIMLTTVVNRLGADSVQTRRWKETIDVRLTWGVFIWAHCRTRDGELRLCWMFMSYDIMKMSASKPRGTSSMRNGLEDVNHISALTRTPQILA